MIKNVEQYIKPEIADKLLSVWSLALASSAHLMHRRLEAIERWVNQVQEAVNWRKSCQCIAACSSSSCTNSSITSVRCDNSYLICVKVYVWRVFLFVRILWFNRQNKSVFFLFFVLFHNILI
jgi:hypothetical protein